jgi:hypothetical protein
MTNYYLITTFIVVLASAKATDKAQLGAIHLPDQGAVASREGRLAHQRSRGLGCDVQVMGVLRVQGHLRVKPAQPTEQGIDAPLRGRQLHLQDSEAGTIYPFSLFVSFSY